MSSINLGLGQLSKQLIKDTKKYQEAIKEGTRRGADKARRLMKSVTPVDQGLMKESWLVKRSGNTYELINDAPHAGIVEDGARPHAVNRAGIEALTQWAYRHFPGADQNTINNVVWGTVHKLMTEGQKPTHILADHIDEIFEMTKEEIEAQLTNYT